MALEMRSNDLEHFSSDACTENPDLEVGSRGCGLVRCGLVLAAPTPHVYMSRIVEELCRMIQTGTRHDLDRFAKTCLVLTFASAQTHREQLNLDQACQYLQVKHRDPGE